MIKNIKITALLVPLIAIGGCFETKSTVRNVFEAKSAFCPLNQDKTYSINIIGKGGSKKAGLIRTINIYGGACNIREIDGIDYSTSQNIMDFIGSRFYELGNGVKVGFNGVVSKKPPKLDQFFVLTREKQNGDIELYTQCSESALKNIKDTEIGCAIDDVEKLHKLALNINYLKPSAILSPIK